MKVVKCHRCKKEFSSETNQKMRDIYNVLYTGSYINLCDDCYRKFAYFITNNDALYQDHLTEPPIPVGDYLPKTISDEELKKIIKDQADMCMAIINGDEIEHENCYEHCSKKLEEEENEKYL